MPEKTEEEVNIILESCSGFNQIYKHNILPNLTNEKIDPDSKKLGNTVHDCYVKFNEFEKVFFNSLNMFYEADNRYLNFFFHPLLLIDVERCINCC